MKNADCMQIAIQAVKASNDNITGLSPQLALAADLLALAWLNTCT